MRWSILLVTCVAFVSSAVAQNTQKPVYQLSTLDSDTVISLDYRGSRLERINTEPTMSILRSGRVVMPKSYAQSTAYEGQISQDQLQDLLDLIIRENGFFDYDENAVQAKLAAVPYSRQVIPVHSATTIIRVTADQVTKEVSYLGLGQGDIFQETAQLMAIRKQLDQIMSVTKLGGEDEANSWLDMANAKLASDYPTVDFLTLDDLQSGTIRKDGSAEVRFARINEADETSTSVTVFMNSNGQSQFAVGRNDLLPASSTRVE